MSLDRRTFLMGGAAVFAQAAPSDQIILGVIGCGGRGRYVTSIFQKNPAVRVGGLCDVYEPNLEKAISAVSKVPNNKPKAYRRYTDLLADKDINAVLIATPEHWHHRQTLDALAAGKDIYVEKPLCQTPEQGVELLKAEQKSKCVVQVGMQRRSYDLYQEGRKIVAGGVLGNVRMARAWWLNNQLRNAPPEKLEGHLDWDQWQGPAKKHPFDVNRFRNWRLFSDYAGGIVGDQGSHVYDGIHMLMNASYPVNVMAMGGKPHFPGADTPDSVVVVAEYPEDFIASFTINYAAMKYQSKNDQLTQLDGDVARMDLGREDCKVYLQGAETTPYISKNSPKGFNAATDMHVENFISCVKSRKPTSAPMTLGFQAALVLQLANQSLKQGRRMHWDSKLKKVEG